MYFLKAAAFALTASLALVDARAISKRAPHSTSGIAERGNDAKAEYLKPRWINKATGEKVSARGLFGLGDEIKISQPEFQANAKACAGALDKLRKLRRKRAARAERKVRRKRADEDDFEDDEDEVMDEETDVEDEGEMEVEEESEESEESKETEESKGTKESEESNMALGPDSHTVRMGFSEFFPFENEEDSTILGTVGINSCSGVLIVGQKGALIAHLEPISPDEGRTEDTFKQDVASKVTGVYTTNQANLAGGKMYIGVPNGDNGEKGILEQTAKDLGLEEDTHQYDRVADDIWETEDYMQSGRGVMMVDFKDTNAIKVKVFGEEKEPPSQPASSDEEMQEGSEEGEIIG
ncbi:MAG: hypothetical protein Q9171_002011 [Xanthocarpia ochracea]